MKKLLILTLMIGTAVLSFYFYFHNVGRLQANVNEIFVTSAEVPQAFNGARVMQISDLLIRNQACLELLANVVETVNILQPEVVVFTGNLFLPSGLAFAEQTAALLSNLDARLVKISVFGYHDLPNAELVEELLSEAGFRHLNNSSFQMFDQSPIGINVIGANPANDRDTMANLLDVHASTMRFNLLLTSIPTFSALSIEHLVDLQLAGHCLATQDTTAISAPCFQFYNGTYQFADRLILHVSPGLARFHTLSGLFRQPIINSFLLRSSSTIEE